MSSAGPVWAPVNSAGLTISQWTRRATSLREPQVLNAVKIDAEAQTLVWPNGADFDPAMLHDWPVYEAALHERARSLEAVRT